MATSKRQNALPTTENELMTQHNDVLHPDRNLGMELVRATEAAAIRSYQMIGKGDKIAVDRTAVDAMRAFLGTVSFRGTVVIGEGEQDDLAALAAWPADNDGAAVRDGHQRVEFEGVDAQREAQLAPRLTTM